MRFEPSMVTEWKSVTKTKPIQAKPVSALFADQSILQNFRLVTPEGDESINSANMICVGGIEKETWQQTARKLLTKYTITGISETGWLTCTPIPGNVEDAVEVVIQGGGEFSIVGLWGVPQPDGTHLQFGKSGDMVLRSPSNHKDVWIVKRGLFDATYEIV